MEYDFDLIDERVDIYNSYSDNIYQNFIDKGKEIFKKYNQEKKCNKKNKKLLFDPNDGKTCYTFKDDKYAHGGYECGDNGYWNEKLCKKYYCDFGYYYDTYEGKCKKDICANNIDIINFNQSEEINLEGKYENKITLDENNNKEYIFYLNNTKYLYFFKVEGNEGFIHYDSDKPCPNFCVIQNPNIMNYTSVHLNHFKNATNHTIIIYISSIEIDINLISTISIQLNKEQISEINPLTYSKLFYFLKANTNYISFFENFAVSTKLKWALYEPEMTASDILNISEKYFVDYKGEIMRLEKEKMYIISISTSSSFDLNKPLKILIQPFIQSNYIEIKEDKTNILFLSKSHENYILDFNKNNKNRIIKLSPCLKNSEIEIIDENMQKNSNLNSNNLYYILSEENKIYLNKLKIKVKEDSLIELLVHFPDDIDLLNQKEYDNYQIKRNTVISFEKNLFNKTIYITINSKTNKPFKYGIMAGYTLGNYYHYSSNYNIKTIKSMKDSDTIEVKLNKNKSIEGEYFYIMLTFDENNINDLYKINLIKSEKFNLDVFNVGIPEDKSKLILNNIIKLIEEGYAYNDIIKNPPNGEYFMKIDLISELKKIETKNKRYFDFYRDIRRITSRANDVYLNILPIRSPNNYNLDNLYICLPFSFYIKGDSKESTYIFIEINDDCFHYYTQEQQNFIISHLNKHLIYINKTTPFEFIQNLQSEFNSIHNKHAQFSITLEIAHKLSLMHNPFTKEQISNIEFVFDGGDNIFLDYYLKWKEKTLLKENEDLKNWKYSTKIKDGFKCLIDEEKKVNVFKLGSIKLNREEKDYLNNYLNSLEVVLNCTKEFYNNSYPIIGIENDNNGGDIQFGLYLGQLLQIKIAQRTYFSMKNSELIKIIFEEKINTLNIINKETCKPFNNFNEMIGVQDDYGNNISLNRTKVFQIFNQSILSQINKIRKEIYKINNLKKPTDIIIFTDGFSLGTSSFFIRNLQERGGAIIVGYKGNPKSDDIFYGTQSISSFNSFKDTDIYKSLKECGFIIKEISFYLSYDDSYQKKSPIPKEYNLIPIDERVNIYHIYNDSYYDKFIDKALEIFDKYNKQKKCNKNNLLIKFDPNDMKTCYKFKNDEHAHGGYQCNENGTWSDICSPYYCDIGYIFDNYNKKCIKDICIKDEELEIISKPQPEKKIMKIFLIMQLF